MSPTPLRPPARAGVVLTALLAALVASVVVAAGASAHVTVSSDDAAAGGYGKLTFRVPNESDTASTVGLRIQIPQQPIADRLGMAAEHRVLPPPYR